MEIRFDALLGSSCSQTRIGNHPPRRNRSTVSLSRRLFPLSFASHHLAFARGREPWYGHECQKHPSTKTATISETKARSARRLVPGILQSTRNRYPCRCSSERIASSQPVSRRLALFILANAAALDAFGVVLWGRFVGFFGFVIGPGEVG